MSNYHTSALLHADIFTVMGSIYAEVARYDMALSVGQSELATQAVARAKEIMNFAQTLSCLNYAQKREIKVFEGVLLSRTVQSQKSMLDSYLLPFAVAARTQR